MPDHIPTGHECGTDCFELPPHFTEGRHVMKRLDELLARRGQRTPYRCEECGGAFCSRGSFFAMGVDVPAYLCAPCLLGPRTDGQRITRVVSRSYHPNVVVWEVA